MSEIKGFSGIRVIPHDAFIMISDYVSVRLSDLIAAYNNRIPDTTEKPSPSGLEKLNEHIRNYDKGESGVENKFGALMNYWESWQREHDRLMLEEVDRRNIYVSKAAQETAKELLEQLEQRIIKRVADALMKSIKGLNADLKLMAEHLKWVADILEGKS